MVGYFYLIHTNARRSHVHLNFFYHSPTGTTSITVLYSSSASSMAFMNSGLDINGTWLCGIATTRPVCLTFPAARKKGLPSHVVPEISVVLAAETSRASALI